LRSIGSLLVALQYLNNKVADSLMVVKVYSSGG